MPAKNPRINVVVEKSLYDVIENLAERDGVSLSLKVRDLVKEAVEIEEDIALAAFAEKREKGWVKSRTLKHGEVLCATEFWFRSHYANWCSKALRHGENCFSPSSPMERIMDAATRKQGEKCWLNQIERNVPCPHPRTDSSQDPASLAFECHIFGDAGVSD